MWNGGILDSPLRWTNIWPKMGFSGNFWKKEILAQLISYLASTLMGWVPWPLYIFVFLASFRPSGGQISGRKWGFRIFLKKNVWLNSFHTWHFILMGWVPWPLYIFVFLTSFSAFWWPNNWMKMRFPELKKSYWLNSFHTWHLSLWGESIDPYTFPCS